MKNKVYYNIATLPNRTEALEKCIDSIYNQTDYIKVILNGHKNIPLFLKNSIKISYTLSDNRYTDSSKFLETSEQEGYIFTLDDDLQVPIGYTDYMIEGIKRYNAIVSLHGKVLKPRPIKYFVSGFDINCQCLSKVSQDTKVDIPGSGVMAWHSSMFNITPEYCKYPNMADIWAAKRAKELGIDIWCLKHDAGYIKHTKHQWTVWRQEMKTGFKKQAEVINQYL